MKHRANILVVDDQRSMRLTLGTILEEIVGSIRKVSDLVSEVAAASE